MVKVGQKAPHFEAQAYVKGDFKNISLADMNGQWVCLFFYPLDFTFVCPTEIEAFQKHLAGFREEGCQVLACSTDSVYSHKAWFERDLKDVEFPILGDTAHKIARAYEVLEEDKGIALRGTFLIDPNGVLQHATINALGTGRSIDETLRTLQALKTGDLCPANWKKGEKTLTKK